MNYSAALEFLYPRTTTIKFGLQTTLGLLEHLGRPDQLVPTIHVGGTNGKGSVTALVASALRVAGFRVGVYTSPHLVSFRERIQVDGEPISEAAVAMWTERLQPLIEASDATFFEATTAMAFADMAARGAELAVVEVGLGGRLDSTNVVAPLVSAVTKIAMDHMKYLGDTLEAIAAEKAWIAKPGAPFIVGETDSGVIEVLRREGERSVKSMDSSGELDIRLVPAAEVWSGSLALAGQHQRRNAAVARAVLDSLPARWRPSQDAVIKGFAKAKIPGRLDRYGKWLFDVAHNPDGMRALAASLRSDPPSGPIHALVSILGDKAWSEMLVELDQVVDCGVLTIAPSADTRRWDIEWLRNWLKKPGRPAPKARWALVPEFDEALAAVEFGAGTILVTGSFHTVGDVMKAKGLSPLGISR